MSPPGRTWACIVHLGASDDGPERDIGSLLAASVHGVPLLTRTVRSLRAVTAQTVVSVPEPLIDPVRRLIGLDADVIRGDRDRGAAVSAVVAGLPAYVTKILVHDAERALVCPDVLADVCAAVDAGAEAALPVLDVPDTIKQVDGGRRVVATIDRGTLRRAQTPQGFTRLALEAVLAQARQAGVAVPDVAAALAEAGTPVTFVPGDERLLRIRSLADLAIAEALMSTSVLRHS